VKINVSKKTGVFGSWSLNQCLDKILITGQGPRKGDEALKLRDIVVRVVEKNGYLALSAEPQAFPCKHPVKILL
jgi:hypothetical protein